MFRQMWTVALVALTGLGSLTLATAQESKEAGGKKQITNSIGMKLVLIPAGEFKMGSGESAEDTAAFFNKTYGEDLLQADLFKDEHPQHRVRITKPFYLGTYHVTRGQFRQFVTDTGYKTDAEKGEKPGAYGWNPDKKEFGFNEKYSWRNAGFEQTDEHPVVNVSWNDAVAFCKWLSQQGRQDLPAANGGRVGIRLPCRDDNPLLQRRRSRDAGQGRQRGRRDGQGEVPGLDMDDQSQRRLCVHGSGGEVQAQCLRALRHARKCVAVVRGLVRRGILRQIPRRRPNRPRLRR